MNKWLFLFKKGAKIFFVLEMWSWKSISNTLTRSLATVFKECIFEPVHHSLKILNYVMFSVFRKVFKPYSMYVTRIGFRFHIPGIKNFKKVKDAAVRLWKLRCIEIPKWERTIENRLQKTAKKFVTFSCATCLYQSKSDQQVIL